MEAIAIGGLCPSISVVRELAALSLVKHVLSRLKERQNRLLPFRSCQSIMTENKPMSTEKPKKSKTVKLPKRLRHINIHAAGIDSNSALKITAEIGIDMSRWKPQKHFASLLGLCRVPRSVAARF